jgi:hypothetical protein
MIESLTFRYVLLWSALVVATLVSWGFGADREPQHPGIISSVVLGVAFAKVAVIGSRFMELRDAPAALRLLFGGWCACTGIAVIAINVW